MMWILNWMKSLLLHLIINIIKCGPIPKHIAIIMDGNRRYGVKNKITLKVAYTRGFEMLLDTVKWCEILGIRELTVYAFSIDNFKRTTDEVTLLMDLFENKLNEFLQKNSLIMQKKVQVNMYGKLSLLPIEVQIPAAKLLLATKKHDSTILNLCVAYSGREEIANAMRTVIKGVRNNIISDNDIDGNLLTQSMYSNENDDPEILIRTSGEVRLSDFLLWQTKCTSLHIVDILWPEWNIWNFLFQILLSYQRHFERLKVIKKFFMNYDFLDRTESKCLYLKDVNKSRLQQLKHIALQVENNI